MRELEIVARLLLEEGWWLLPLLFGISWWWMRRRGMALRGPVFWFLLIGLVLPIGTLLYFLGHQEVEQAGAYHPPIYRPGSPVVPGSVGR